MSPLSFISCWGLRSCRLFTNTLLPAAYSPFPTCCQIQPSEAEETRRSSASIVLVLFVFYFLQINRAKALLLPASLMWSSGFVFVFRLLVRWNHCLTPNETFSTLLVTQRSGALIAERGRALIRFFGQMHANIELDLNISSLLCKTKSVPVYRQYLQNWIQRSASPAAVWVCASLEMITKQLHYKNTETCFQNKSWHI